VVVELAGGAVVAVLVGTLVLMELLGGSVVSGGAGDLLEGGEGALPDGMGTVAGGIRTG